MPFAVGWEWVLLIIIPSLCLGASSDTYMPKGNQAKWVLQGDGIGANLLVLVLYGAWHGTHVARVAILCVAGTYMSARWSENSNVRFAHPRTSKFEATTPTAWVPTSLQCLLERLAPTPVSVV